MNAGAGLFYEAAADLVYPLDSVISTSILTLIFGVSSAIYTMLGSRISPAAMNWSLTGIVHGIVFVFLFPLACGSAGEGVCVPS